MRKITLITLLMITVLGYAQIGINTNTPDISSAFEIESTTGGILIPRMKETQRNAILSPAVGLMIYQTDEISGFYFYNGTAWTKIDGVAGPQGDKGDKGDKGDTGEAGPPGIMGPEGTQEKLGPQGYNGSRGHTRRSRSTWSRRHTRSTRYDGSRGYVQEKQILQGPEGIPGPPGMMGPEVYARRSRSTEVQKAYLVHQV